MHERLVVMLGISLVPDVGLLSSNPRYVVVVVDCGQRTQAYSAPVAYAGSVVLGEQEAKSREELLTTFPAPLSFDSGRGRDIPTLVSDSTCRELSCLVCHRRLVFL